MKRFIPELTDKIIEFLSDDKTIQILHILYDYQPQIEVEYFTKNPEDVEITQIQCVDFVELMSIKARGKRINNGVIKEIRVLDPIPYEEEEELNDDSIDEIEDNEDGDSSEGELEEEDLDYKIAKEIFDTIDTTKTEKTDQQEKKEPEPRKVFKKKEPSKDEDEWEQLTLF